MPSPSNIMFELHNISSFLVYITHFPLEQLKLKLALPRKPFILSAYLPTQKSRPCYSVYFKSFSERVLHTKPKVVFQ